MTLPLPTPVIQVAVPVPLFSLFDYHLPADLPTPAIGSRVSIPFGTRVLIGIALGPGMTDGSAIAELGSLKSILEVLDEQPILPPDLLKLLLWAAQYYHFPIGEVLSAALPTLLRQGRGLDLLTRYWQVSSEIHQRLTASPDSTADLLRTLSRSPRQQQALEILKLHDERGAPESILTLLGVDRKALQQLEKRGWVHASMRPHEHIDHPVSLASLPLTPNAEQAHAIATITQALGRFQGILLNGLTGSGKTEVYLQAMQPVLERGQQVLVLVPEIGLTPQTVDRFQSRFHAHIVLLHSNMTDLARLQSWQAAYTGRAQIVIGTRSAVFAPLPRLGLIIIDEEHDLSYKQQDTFRYHARDVALKRGLDLGCPVLLGSATPSLESLHLAHEQRLWHLHLTTRAGDADLARIHLIDLRGKKKDNGLSLVLIDAIRTHLKAADQVLVFLNRRGFAPILQCDACGWQADCPRCDAHLTVHYTPKQHLHCHHCSYQSRLPPVCPTCHSPNLIPTGSGTARLEETLNAHFAEYPVLRVDRDTTSKVGSWDKIYQRAHEAGPAILLGTQMLAKGHHFPHVTLVAIVDVDGGFFSADFRAPERTAQLILQVAGRSGRGSKRGQVLIQTRRPENPFLVTLIREGYEHFAQDLLRERRAARLPPYRHAALIRAESLSMTKTESFLQQAVLLLREHETLIQQGKTGGDTLEVWGPIPAPMEKRAGYFRGHVLILAQERRLLHDVIEPWWPAVMHLPDKRGVRATLDIDPMELS